MYTKAQKNVLYCTYTGPSDLCLWEITHQLTYKDKMEANSIKSKIWGKNECLFLCVI